MILNALLGKLTRVELAHNVELPHIFSDKYEDPSRRKRQVVSPFSVISIFTTRPPFGNYMIKIVSRWKCTFYPTLLNREPREYFYQGTYMAVAYLPTTYTYTVRWVNFYLTKTDQWKSKISGAAFSRLQPREGGAIKRDS